MSLPTHTDLTPKVPPSEWVARLIMVIVIAVVISLAWWGISAGFHAFWHDATCDPHSYYDTHKSVIAEDCNPSDYKGPAEHPILNGN